MASGSIVGEGGNEGCKGKQSFVETKVYTRRVFRGSRKSVGGITVTSSASPTASLVAPVPVPVPDTAVALPAENVVAATATSHNAIVTRTTSPVDGTDAAESPGTAPIETTTAVATPSTPLVNSALDPFVSAAVIPASSPVTRANVVTSPVVVTAGVTPPVDIATGATSPVDTATETITGVTPLVDATIATSVPVVEKSVDLVGPAASPMPVDATTTTVATSTAARDSTASDSLVIVTVSGNKNERESGHGHQIDGTQAPKPQVHPLEGVVLEQQEPFSCLDAPDDLNSYHRHQDIVGRSSQDVNTGNGERNRGMESRMKVNLALKSKQERRELRRKLESELDKVMGLVRRIEAAEVQHSFGRVSSLRVSVNDGIENGMRRVSLDSMAMGFPRESATPIATPTPMQSRSFSQLSVSVMDNGQGIGEIMEKEKRTPKANPLYRNSEFLLAKDKFPPVETNKKSKLNGKRHGGETGLGFGPSTKVFRNCCALLEKLMKHKHGWVFNTPVDVEALRLHDYYSIIKHPMDLGTVKSRLNTNWYKAPEEFAEDVRLTFHNALTYNPKGQDVHIMAELLLKIFVDKWAVIKSDYDREMQLSALYHMGIPTPSPRKAPPLPQLVPLDMRRILDRSESMTYPSFDSRPKPIITTPSVRTPAPKKPKAKDPNKRDMTYEEKQKLSTNLQNLPSEKLDNIVQIIKKRNSALSQHDDEIEVDIDSVDTETLWELDRFVTNYKKSLSKNKRKAELAMQARAEAEKNVQEKILAPIVVEAPKENKTVTDERIVPTASPVQAEKLGDDGSRSSSSSSSSSDSESSSTDSDSDSSSASGSDVGH